VIESRPLFIDVGLLRQRCVKNDVLFSISKGRLFYFKMLSLQQISKKHSRKTVSNSSNFESGSTISKKTLPFELSRLKNEALYLRIEGI